MNNKQGLINDAIRTVFGAIDWILFSFLDWMYRVFFDVSTVEFLTGETIRNFFSRIQLILGVFMVFKISISILQAIVEPDKITDKSNGFSAYIKRIIICLIMLTLLIPRNIPNAKNEYQVQINNNGLLFGTLYSLQGRILRNNTLGKLVLGKSTGNVTLSEGSDSNTNYGNEQAKSMKEMGRDFTVTILKGFVQQSNKCSNFDSTDAGKAYASDSVDQTQLLMDNINGQCKDHYYAYMYYPIIGGVVAAVFAVILIGFSIDIAVRALKLAILRLLAPIPIISYLDPNQEKKGAFANWVKILTATYLDLFIRLAIIYFVIFLINDIKDNGIVMGTENDTFMNVIVFIVICFGLFFFAKQAPKFIKDVLGVQNAMQNIGLASILGGTAMAMGGGGLTGFAYGAMNGARSQVDAYNQGKAAPVGSAWSSNRDLMAKIRTGDKDAQGGIFGRAQDYLNYQTRERNARRLGIGAQDVADAKYIADAYEKMMLQAQDEMEDAKMKYQYDPTNQQYADAYHKAAAKYGSYAEAYKKANKRYEAMDKTRGQLGIAPTAESVREIKPLHGNGEPDKSGNYRSPLKTEGEFVFDPNTMPDSIKPFEKDNEIKSSITGHRRDTNGFDGTIDDSFGSGSMGTGAAGSSHQGGGPGGRPGGHH
ncbi:MAG: hypothetical protein Q4E69_00095 [Bacilli bacterium]|nr:hypothetical protein [Bacilli bacterium]